MKPLPPNPTVQDLIDVLMSIEDKSRIVCVSDIEEPRYSSVENLGIDNNVDYIDYNGDQSKGDIVWMF